MRGLIPKHSTAKFTTSFPNIKQIGYWALLEGAEQELLSVFRCCFFTVH